MACTLMVLALASGPLLNAQTDLGQPDIWYTQPAQPVNGQPPLASTIDLIGNHPVLSQDSVKRAIERFQDLDQRGHTVFLVVRPLYPNPSGKTYWRSKGLEITDSEILYRGAGRAFVPDKNRPLILSASFPAFSRRGGRPGAPKLDTSLFKVAEFIAYNRFFSKTELRQMEAYLSLKYSIPTTKNDDNSLRAYPSDSSSSYYWTPKKDKVYDREVIALGNFSFSGLQQSQTVAFHDDSLIVALDSIVAFGQMPLRHCQEGSFLIIAKRIDQSSLYDCELHLNQAFPITAWRLRTQNFHSNADSLRLYYPNHQQSSFNDTLILTDGMDTIPLNSQQLGNDLAMSFALSSIKANRLYRFRVKGNACDDTASIGLSPQGPGLLSLRADSELLPLEVVVQSQEGDGFYDTTMYRSPMQLVAGAGQYQVEVQNQAGELQRDFLIAGSAGNQNGIQFVAAKDKEAALFAAEGKRIVVYPNPGFTGELAHFEFHDFPEEEQLKVQVYDPQGRLIHQEDLVINGSLFRWDFPMGIPGSYNFIFLHQDQTYSQKLTVTKRF